MSHFRQANISGDYVRTNTKLIFSLYLDNLLNIIHTS